MKQVRLPPGPWEGCCLETGGVPEWAGLVLDHGWEGLESSLRAVPGSTAKTEVCRHVFGGTDTCVSHQSLSNLDCSLTAGRGVGAECRALSRSSEVQMCLLPGTCASRTSCGMWLGGAGTENRAFPDIWDCRQKWLPLGPQNLRTAGRLADCGCMEDEALGLFQNLEVQAVSLAWSLCQ